MLFFVVVIEINKNYNKQKTVSFWEYIFTYLCQIQIIDTV